jgi:hypothetical protein
MARPTFDEFAAWAVRAAPGATEQQIRQTYEERYGGTAVRTVGPSPEAFADWARQAAPGVDDREIERTYRERYGSAGFLNEAARSTMRGIGGLGNLLEIGQVLPRIFGMPESMRDLAIGAPGEARAAGEELAQRNQMSVDYQNRPWYSPGKIVAGQVPEVLVGMLPQLATGAAVPGAAVGSYQEAEPFYRELRESGMGEGEALARAGLFGLGVAGLNYLPLQRIFNRTPGRLLTGALEAATETAEGGVQSLLDPRRALSDIPADLLREAQGVAAPSFVIGTLLGGGGNQDAVAAEHPQEELRRRMMEAANRGAAQQQAGGAAGGLGGLGGLSPSPIGGPGAGVTPVSLTPDLGGLGMPGVGMPPAPAPAVQAAQEPAGEAQVAQVAPDQAAAANVPQEPSAEAQEPPAEARATSSRGTEIRLRPEAEAARAYLYGQAERSGDLAGTSPTELARRIGVSYGEAVDLIREFEAAGALESMGQDGAQWRVNPTTLMRLPNLSGRPLRPPLPPEPNAAGRMAELFGLAGNQRPTTAQPSPYDALPVVAPEPGESAEDWAKRLKAHAKANIDNLPLPDAKQMSPSWESYFDVAQVQGAEDIDLLPIKSVATEKDASDKGSTVALKRFEAASRGKIPRREPVVGQLNNDGTVTVYDGNGTVNALRQTPVTRVPVRIGRLEITDPTKVAYEASLTPEQRMDLYRQRQDAQRFKPEFDRRVRAAQEAARPGTEALIPGIKKFDRIVEKVQGEDRGNTAIKDMVRATIIAETPAEMRAAIRAVREQFGADERQSGIYREKSSLLDNKPDEFGYMDHKVNVRMGGRIYEIQIMPRALFDAKQGEGHKIYVQARAIEAAAKAAGRDLTPDETAALDRLAALSRQIYSEALAPFVALLEAEAAGGQVTPSSSPYRATSSALPPHRSNVPSGSSSTLRALPSQNLRPSSSNSLAPGSGTSGTPPRLSGGLSTDPIVAAPQRIAVGPDITLDVQPMVVEAASLVTSDQPGYPQERQPRDRSRVGSAAQVQEIASSLRPELLGLTPTAKDGAPIIDGQGIVESGNGRVQALRLAAQRFPERFQAYRDWLAAQGFDVAGMQVPVLVRQRINELSTQQILDYTVEANRPDQLGMSTIEQAAADSRLLDSAVIDVLQPGDIGGAANIGFARAFLARLPAAARGSMIQANGTLNADGVRRLEAAVMYRAYGGDPTADQVLTAALESRDDVQRSITGALLDAAPAVASLRQAIAEGRVDQSFDVAPEIARAISSLRAARQAGTPIAELVQQRGMFEQEREAMEKGVLRLLMAPNLQRIASRDGIAEALTAYANQAAAQRTDQGSMFGGPASPTEVMRQTIDTFRGAAALAARVGTFRPGITFAAARDLLAAYRARNPGAPPLVLVPNAGALPPEVLQALGPDVSGAYDHNTGRVYVVASNLRGRFHAEAVLAHEVVGHAGMMRLMGDRWPWLTAQVQRLKARDPIIRRIADEVGEVYGQLDADIESAEIIAHLAERSPKHPLTQKVLAWFREALRRLGFRVNLSRNDLVYLLGRAADGMLRPARPMGTTRSGTVFAAIDPQAGEQQAELPLPPGETRRTIEQQVQEQEAAAFQLQRPQGQAGQPTQLQKSLFASRALTQSPEFKAWFGDSKVVRPDGKPLVVYHGGLFNELDDPVPVVNGNGFHFGTAQAAQDRMMNAPLDRWLARMDAQQDPTNGRWYWYSGQDYSGDLEDSDGYATYDEAIKGARKWAWFQHTQGDHFEEDQALTAAYLSIQRPLRVPDQTTDWSQVIADAKAAGFDGLVYRNRYEDAGSDSWVVFSPEQIKSVNNVGTFDPNNPSILAKRAWHGSPTRFDRFDLDLIPDHASNQIYGWGIYLTNAKDVALHYAERSKRPNGPTAYLYESDIPDEIADGRMLQWGSRLSEQPPPVREALGRLLRSAALPAEEARNLVDRDATGEAIYRRLAKDGGQRAASLVLDSLGIPGAQVPGEEGSQTLVVWSQPLLDVAALSRTAVARDASPDADMFDDNVDGMPDWLRSAVASGIFAARRSPEQTVRQQQMFRPERVEVGGGNYSLAQFGGLQDSELQVMLDIMGTMEAPIEAQRRGTRTWDTTEQAAIQKVQAELGITLDGLVRAAPGSAANAETLEAYGMILGDAVRQLVTLTDRAAQTGARDDKLAVLAAREKLGMLLAPSMGYRTEAGRALNILRKQAQLNKTALQLMEELGGGSEQHLDDFIKRVNQAGTVDQVLGVTRAEYRATWWDKWYEYWINGLLSGPTTHSVNITSNGLYRVLEEAAAAVGAATSRDYSLRQVAARIAALPHAATIGLRNGVTAFQTEEGVIDPRDKIEAAKQRAIGGTLGRIVRLPGRLLRAEDEFFKSIGYYAELADIAMGEALRTNPADPMAEFHRLMGDVMNRPDWIKRARDAAARGTFTQPLGQLGNLGTYYLNKSKIGRMIVPFVRTPTNILKTAIDYTPAAPLRQEVRDALSAGGRDAALARGRMIVGSGLMLATLSLAAQGLLSGAGPDDDGERALLMRTGWQPYSVKIGDQWVKYNRLEPAGMVLGMAADFYELAGYMAAGELEKIPAMMVTALALNLGDKTFLRGVTDFAQAYADPDRYLASWAQNMAASAMPASVLMGQVARQGDPFTRQARTLMDRVRERLPSEREALAKRIDIGGDPIMQTQTIGVPTAVSQQRSDPLAETMLRLGISHRPPQRRIQNVELNDQEYESYATAIGQARWQVLTPLAQSPQFRAVMASNPELARAILDRQWNQVTEAARTRWLYQHPEVITKLMTERGRPRAIGSNYIQ